MSRRRANGILVPEDLSSKTGLTATEILLLSDIARYPEYFKSRQEIADILGISREYVSKLLSNLRNKGYIEQIGHDHNRGVYQITPTAKKFYRLRTQLAVPDISHDDQRQYEVILQQMHKTLGGGRKLLLTPGRISKLKQRLRTFTRDDLFAAAYHLSLSDFHMGKNDSGIKYATVDFLIRNDEQVDRWLNIDIQATKANNLSGSVF